MAHVIFAIVVLLYYVYDSHSGTVDPLEFFLFLREPRTRVLNYIIPIIAANPREYEKMTFTMWMLSVFGFCFMTEQELKQRQQTQWTDMIAP